MAHAAKLVTIAGRAVLKESAMVPLLVPAPPATVANVEVMVLRMPAALVARTVKNPVSKENAIN